MKLAATFSPLTRNPNLNFNPLPSGGEGGIKSKITSKIKSFAVSAAFLLLGGMLAAPAAAPVKIRLATLAPKDTSPHKSLQQMGESWRKSTGDQNWGPA